MARTIRLDLGSVSKGGSSKEGSSKTGSSKDDNSKEASSNPRPGPLVVPSYKGRALVWLTEGEGRRESPERGELERGV